MQTSIANSVSATGVGLHSGKHIYLTFRQALLKSFPCYQGMRLHRYIMITM